MFLYTTFYMLGLQYRLQPIYRETERGKLIDSSHQHSPTQIFDGPKCQGDFPSSHPVPSAPEKKARVSYLSF